MVSTSKLAPEKIINDIKNSVLYFFQPFKRAWSGNEKYSEY